jgi:putative hemolysin
MRKGGPVRRTLARLVVRAADALTRALGASASDGWESITGAQLRSLVAANTRIQGEERQIIDEVLAAGGRHVREVMVPRTDVVFLDASLPVPAAVGLIRGARHSRFPVIDGSHDDVVGFVHLRDLLIPPVEPNPPGGTVAAGGAGLGTVGALARDVKRVPAGKRVLPALSEMRREGHHLAVVIDEYGGTAGIVTLEDLIEELVGEITDEYDLAPDPDPTDGVPPAEVDGRLNLTDFAERTGYWLPVGPYETVGGFLMARLGRLPRVGDEVPIERPSTAAAPASPPVDHVRLVVTALDGRRVSRVALVSAVPGARAAAD